MKEKNPFRDSLAGYLKILKAQGIKKKNKNPYVLGFCAGWTAHSNEIDKITDKMEEILLK